VAIVIKNIRRRYILNNIAGSFERLGKKDFETGIRVGTFEHITVRGTTELLEIPVGPLVLLDRLVKGSDEWAKDTAMVTEVLGGLKGYQKSVIKEAALLEKTIESEIEGVEAGNDELRKEYDQLIQEYHKTKSLRTQREAKDINTEIRDNRKTINEMESDINKLQSVVKMVSKWVGILSAMVEANTAELTNKELTAIVKKLEAKIKKLEKAVK
jgi:archaellum component FlaC